MVLTKEEQLSVIDGLALSIRVDITRGIVDRASLVRAQRLSQYIDDYVEEYARKA